MRMRTKISTIALAGAAAFVPAAAALPAFAQATGTVQTGGTNLTVRSCGSTSCSVVGSLSNGTQVTIYCQVTGDWINGNWGWTDLWDQIRPSYLGNALVTDGFVNTGSNGWVASPCH